MLTQQDIDWAKKKIPSKVDTTPAPAPVEKTKPTEPIYTPEEQGEKWRKRDIAKANAAAVKKNNPAIDELTKVNNRLYELGSANEYDTPEYKELEERRKTLERVARPGMAAVNAAKK